MIFLNVVHGPAPRSRAASSSERSNPISRERTTTTTKEIENMMCAISSVVKPSGSEYTMNIESSAAPMTISGEAIGRMIRRFAALRPRNW